MKINILKIPLIILLLLSSSPLLTIENEIKPDRKLIIAAWKLSSRISPKPQKLNYVFDKSFFNHISKEKLVELLKKIYQENGEVIEISTVSIENAYNANFFFKTKRDFIIPVSIGIENKKGKIISLFFRPSFKKAAGLEEIVNEFEKLNYQKKAILIKKLGQIEDTIYAKNENETMAIASAFKLYVLANLVEENTKWDKTIKIKNEDKAVFGKLHLYPDNAPVTIYSLALAMISESDNTATDILIDHIKREKIEENLLRFKNSHPELNIPFLKTSEMFKIKYSTELYSEYFSSKNIKDKKKLLEKIKKEKINSFNIKLNEPVLINTLEWYASASDICKLMEYFKDKNDIYINAILSMNPGLDTKTHEFKFSGYKGGAEPGVVSANWLLQTKSGSWYCFSAIINDEKRLINEKELFNVFQNIINLIGMENF